MAPDAVPDRSPANLIVRVVGLETLEFDRALPSQRPRINGRLRGCGRMRLTAKHRAHLTVIRIAAACAGALVTTTLVAQSVFPTGTTRYDPKKAFNSFVLFTSDTVARLIDMNGN